MEGTQHPARVRIDAILDAHTFVEIGAEVQARSTDLLRDSDRKPSDGVITGYGLIDSRPVYVYAQDPSVLGGSIGEMHARKIYKIYELALKTGAPVIGLLDSSGLRIEEGIDSLHAFGRLYRIQTEASGRIPQISCILGNCGGGMALLPALSDFTFLDMEKGRLFLHAPNAIPGNAEEQNDTASPAQQAMHADFTGTEAEIFAGVRKLLTFLPDNNEEDVVPLEAADLNAVHSGLDAFSEDPLQILLRISDPEQVLPCREEAAPEMLTAFVRIGGFAAGVLANRTAHYDASGEVTARYENVLTPEGAAKAADFIAFCDAFSIPLVTLTNSRQLEATTGSEKTLPRMAARLAGAFASATVPKINLLTGDSYGTAALLMNSRALGADLVYAWDAVRVGAMEAGSAARILTEGTDAEALRQAKEAYEQMQNQAASAGARGYIDARIAPEESRKYLIGALDMLYMKQEDRPWKKHRTRE